MIPGVTLRSTPGYSRLAAPRLRWRWYSLYSGMLSRLCLFTPTLPFRLRRDDFATLPNHPGANRIPLDAVDDHLVDERSQEGFLLLPGETALRPLSGEILADVLQGFSRGRIEGSEARILLLLTLERFLGSLQVAEGLFPSPFKLGGHQAVVGVGLVELPFGQPRPILHPLQLLLVRTQHFLTLLVGRLPTFIGPEALVRQVNHVLRGWANYFCYGTYTPRHMQPCTGTSVAGSVGGCGESSRWMGRDTANILTAT